MKDPHCLQSQGTTSAKTDQRMAVVSHIKSRSCCRLNAQILIALEGQISEDRGEWMTSTSDANSIAAPEVSRI
jgi:hypothetical protein